MKKLWSIGMAFALMMMVEVVYADTEQTWTVDMQLEHTSVAIPPKNRWIADYSMTPIIIAQVLKEQKIEPQVLKEPTIKPQVLKEPTREPQVLKEEPTPVPQKRLKKLLLGARRKIDGLKQFFKKLL
jgi:hypothetical protein